MVCFQDAGTWGAIEVPLVEMKLSDVIELVKKLDIPTERMSFIVEKMRSSNLSGLVLSACDLSEVQQALKLNLGDWTLFKLLIETLRSWEPISACLIETPHSLTSPPAAAATATTAAAAAALASSTSLSSSIQEHKRRLTSQNW
ncbi:unnamed protein product [Gongylonema pulchrum]|uniref:Kinase D-interacting substrate of 220 kDa-like SAM domain-containing protein n=1 Tax=Gongylonema pulchrum TaxID=637853 RepID=A0A183EXE1_9BILA|nr:unnamed protein product [Gongylonema pulchrum]